MKLNKKWSIYQGLLYASNCEAKLLSRYNRISVMRSILVQVIGCDTIFDPAIRENGSKVTEKLLTVFRNWSGWWPGGLVCSCYWVFSLFYRLTVASSTQNAHQNGSHGNAGSVAQRFYPLNVRTGKKLSSINRNAILSQRAIAELTLALQARKKTVLHDRKPSFTSS